MNILLQTVLDAATSAIGWYITGYAFAFGYGDHRNGFIGDAMFTAHNFMVNNGGAPMWQFWFFEWAFAATATTIPAGAVAERFNFYAYISYSLLVSSFIYPVVVHWVWAGPVADNSGNVTTHYGGWLNYSRGYLFKSGMIDYAGSSVVHMVGGLTGLMGCLFVGPRLGRFDSSGKPVDMPGHSATLVVLGTVLLWFGWYGFNPGSQLSVTTNFNAQVAGRAAVTTTLAGAAGCISCVINAFIRNKNWDLVAGCNGALVGFVAITASANVVEPWAAIICGYVGGIIFDGVCALFLKLKIDDPLSAAPMHGFCGAWGVFFAGLLARKEYICHAYGRGCADPANPGAKLPWSPYGLFYYGGGGRLIASQVVGILVIAGWVCFLSGSLFAVLKAFGKIRISAEEEQAGLDVSKHGGSAYNSDTKEGKAMGL
eukprot:CAMPEP_0175039094 /NCGR_PEP_ID=MMETSP0052_2-20121109/323_1 /TAXON_ID=51329 ORGANISM="Polytomella parva, Strain SAG 63-3" /NCGR_SAMPLE_ID=MMETSP0052_2 /ASSEMBLY_ACC=CAM_ASM_000194 /LENGTH=426 /DNA_ID=CAMNT_0016300769 /DNA_START=412 /DNA_END=1692 /DNA_ORIENTATION=-